MEKLRVLSLFSGIGAFEKALTNLGIPYELVNYCEINEHASKCYSLIIILLPKLLIFSSPVLSIFLLI